MRLDTEIVLAKDVEPDCFIYLPKEKRFFWVDDIDHEGKIVIFYFEEGFGSRGLNDFSIEVGRYSKVIVVNI